MACSTPQASPVNYLEVELREGKVVFTPKVLIDRRLQEAMEDLREGRVHGPFGSVDAMLDSLHRAAAPTRSGRPGKA